MDILLRDKKTHEKHIENYISDEFYSLQETVLQRKIELFMLKYR